MSVCQTRGCNRETQPGRWTKCAECLLGLKPAFARKVTAAEAVLRMPALVVPAGSWGFRVPGSPMSWNHALVRTRGRPYLSDAAREWKKAIAMYGVKARPRDWARYWANPLNRYGVEVHSFFARSNSDADGPVKLVLDALQGVAWPNDREVGEVVARKSVDAAAPRLEVIVRLTSASDNVASRVLCANIGLS